ncbi:MAG: hypothetical protein ACRD68_07315 [Pyrinomonadaceae bacterium]
MRQKITRLLLAAAGAAALLCSAACKKDAQVDSILAELDSFTQELLKKIESNPDPSAGVDEARKYFDSERAEIAAKLAVLKEVRGDQVANSDEVKRKMLDSLYTDLMSMEGLRTRYMSNSMRDPAFKEKLEKLVSDYKQLFDV